MMTYKALGNYISAERFRPFRIRMASGQEFEIRHPEMILVGRTSARVYAPNPPDSDGPDHWHEPSLMLMESIEPLDQPAAYPSNQA